MVFNSLEFLAFIFVFFILYFNMKGKARLWLCLIASYFFYGMWDWRFLGLIGISTVIDYQLGLALENEENQKKRTNYLIISMIMNLGFLAFFKYFNFFADSFAVMVEGLGMTPSWNTLNIILPVGISFYTFQSMSYSIDVYKRNIPVEKDFIKFATFIAFFPQLVAGPIVRASEFLPQFDREIKWNWERFISGSGQILWGFFKKVAVADSLALVVDNAFFDPMVHSSMQLAIGVVFYSFQIYCDFSGYSDIAIGLARIMGFDFPDNFRTPYFSKNFSEFWTRWHITLSSWLRDYLYISMGGNRGGGFGSISIILVFMAIPIALTRNIWVIAACVALIIGTWLYMKQGNTESKTGFNYMNLMNTMLLGGLWHGASWVFVFWGFLHGSYLVVQRLIGPYFGALMRFLRFPKFLQDGVNIVIVYFFTCLAWIYFRAPDFQIANEVVTGIASLENFNWANVTNKFGIASGFMLIGMLLFVEITDFKFKYAGLLQRSPAFRVVSFATILWIIAFFGTFGANAFIYFQF